MNIAFTVCSANYLPYAKSVADSFIEHNPGYEFIIVVVEPEQHYDPAFFQPHRIMQVPTASIPEFKDMNSRYNTFELCCSLSPHMAEYLLKTNPQCDILFYLDTDIYVFGAFTEAEALLKKHSYIITPHMASTAPHPALTFFELNMLKAGVYNSGFWGLSRCNETFELLAWWKNRLSEYCYNTPEKGVFVDQIWLNFFPIYFQQGCILNNPGYNMAYWNLHERTLTVKDGNYFVNENYPLVFYHFSGYDIRKPGTLSKWQNFFSFKDLPLLKPVFEKYRIAALKNNRDNLMDLVPGYGKKPAKEEKKQTALRRLMSFVKK